MFLGLAVYDAKNNDCCLRSVYIITADEINEVIRLGGANSASCTSTA